MHVVQEKPVMAIPASGSSAVTIAFGPAGSGLAAVGLASGAVILLSISAEGQATETMRLVGQVDMITALAWEEGSAAPLSMPATCEDNPTSGTGAPHIDDSIKRNASNTGGGDPCVAGSSTTCDPLASSSSSTTSSITATITSSTTTNPTTAATTTSVPIVDPSAPCAPTTLGTTPFASGSNPASGASSEVSTGAGKAARASLPNPGARIVARLASVARDRMLCCWDLRDEGKLAPFMRLRVPYRRGEHKPSGGAGAGARTECWVAMAWPAGYPGPVLSSAAGGELVSVDLGAQSPLASLTWFTNAHSRCVFGLWATAPRDRDGTQAGSGLELYSVSKAWSRGSAG